MHALLLCLALGQGPRLELPAAIDAGATLVARATAGGAPIGGEIRCELLDAAGRSLGWHAGNGAVRITLDAPGPYTLRWLAPDGSEVFAPFHVLAPRAWWFTAAWTVPAGLLLAWSALRQARPRLPGSGPD